MIEYIYAITNTVNNKLYIGRTNNPNNRKRCHFSELRRNKHNNPKLQNAFNKHGEESFTFSVIDCGKTEDICKKEEQWFDLYNRDSHVLYNCHFRSTGGPICNLPLSEETKVKISDSIKQNTRSYIFDILTERYETKESLRNLSIKYGVGINTMVDYINEWECKTGKKMIKNTQIEDTIMRVGNFIEDYNKGIVNLSKVTDYGTTAKSVRKYCVVFDAEPEDFIGCVKKQDAKQKAVNAIKYMKQNGCSALEAIKQFDSSVTTFYKYLKA